MDFLSSVFTWLSEREAGISAVVGIAVLAGILCCGTHWLPGRRAETTAEKPSGSCAGETTSAAGLSARKLVVSAVDPGFVEWLFDSMPKAGLKD